MLSLNLLSHSETLEQISVGVSQFSLLVNGWMQDVCFDVAHASVSPKYLPRVSSLLYGYSSEPLLICLVDKILNTMIIVNYVFMF